MFKKIKFVTRTMFMINLNFKNVKILVIVKVKL